MGKLQARSYARGADRQRTKFTYAIGYRTVCRENFLFAHALGDRVLRNIQEHMKQNGCVPRQHGNVGRLPANTIPFEATQQAVRFIHNFALVHGLPQPAAPRGRADTAPTYLPASENFHSVHVGGSVQKKRGGRNRAFAHSAMWDSARPRYFSTGARAKWPHFPAPNHMLPPNGGRATCLASCCMSSSSEKMSSGLPSPHDNCSSYYRLCEEFAVEADSDQSEAECAASNNDLQSTVALDMDAALLCRLLLDTRVLLTRL